MVSGTCLNVECMISEEVPRRCDETTTTNVIVFSFVAL